MLLAHQEDFSHLHDQAASGIDHAAGWGTIKKEAEKTH
jgi:hypothetical protein